MSIIPNEIWARPKPQNQDFQPKVVETSLGTTSWIPQGQGWSERAFQRYNKKPKHARDTVLTSIYTRLDRTKYEKA